MRDAENAAAALSADHSSTCTNTAVALTPHLLSSAFLPEQLKVLLHFLQVVKPSIDVRSLLRDPQLSADLFLLALLLFIDLRRGGKKKVCRSFVRVCWIPESDESVPQTS